MILFVLMAYSLAPAVTPYATSLVSYTAGTTVQDGYTDGAKALGMPNPSIPGWPDGIDNLTMFNGPWSSDDLVSIGAGGSLVVMFDHPVENDPLNPFGLDLIVFGNAGFMDNNWPNGTAGGIMREPGKIAVSQDGSNWYEIAGVFADDLFPTQAYTNTSSPYGRDGSILSDFTKPVDPGIAWQGKPYNELLAMYDGSGGGTGVDIESSGLPWIQYVKVYQNIDDDWSTEIDAFADVTPTPEPVTGMLLAAGLAVLSRRRRSRRA